ncbi:alpha/beta fold hydrolase [Oceanithermus sp.]
MDPRIEALRRFRRRQPLHTLERGGRVWRYYALGEGPRTLLFLHGMAGAGDIWFQQLEVYARRWRVVATTYPPEGSLARLADGVLAVLDAAGAREAVVVGSSLGGLLAQYLAARRPERVERAVFANTFPPGHPEILKGRRMAALARWLPERLVLGAMLRNARRKLVPAAGGDALLAGYLEEQYTRRMRKADVLARSRAVFETFAPPEPRMPHAVFEAANDPLIPPRARADLKARYPEAFVRDLGAVGHFPYLSHPERFNAALDAFLEP